MIVLYKKQLQSSESFTAELQTEGGPREEQRKK